MTIGGIIGLLIIISVLYLIYLYAKKTGVFNNDGMTADEILWGKAIWGLYITIPIILFAEFYLQDQRSGVTNVAATAVNFIITKFIVKKIIKKKLNFRFPKLITATISIVVFIIQVLLGTIIWHYAELNY